MESFECMGVWWLPTDPQTKIPGMLAFDPANGAKLELLGAFSESYSVGDGRSTRYAIIHGFATGRYPRVTLSQCHVQVVGKDPGKDFKETKLYAEQVFMSERHRLSDIEETVFKSIKIGFTYLSDWMLQDNSTNVIQHVAEDSVHTYGGSYSIQLPEESDYDNARIDIWPAKAIRTIGRTETSVKYEFRCTITPQQNLHLDDYLPLINFYLPNFLALGTGRAVFPLKIVGRQSDASSEFHIFYRIPRFVEQWGSMLPGQMLFTFEDVRDKFAKYLAVWISNGEKLWTVYDHYSKSYYQRGLDLTTEFLDLARALEVYHRSVYGGKYLCKDEYKPIKTKLIASIPSDVKKCHRDALKGTLKYGYQYSLRTRLNRVFKKLLAEQSDDVMRLFGTPKDFVHRLVETRNYFTHRDGDPDEAVLNDDELYDFIRKMRRLLQICLLKEMEFPPDEISRILNNNIL